MKVEQIRTGCDKQKKPLVSVIMGIYNCAATLGDAIRSIQRQTYHNWELILCDDASTDNTLEIARQYKALEPERIILLQNETNKKLAFTLNRCLKAASGEFIARMDGDDLSAPNRLETQVNWLLSHPEYQLVGTAMFSFIDDPGAGHVMLPPSHPDRWTMRKGIPFFHATIMTYKSVYDQLGGYTVSSRTSRAQDYDLWFRFYAAGFNGDNLEEPLYLVRENQMTFRRRTAKYRWQALQTTIYGYRLLGFPKRWLIKPIIMTTLKSMIPPRLVAWMKTK